MVQETFWKCFHPLKSPPKNFISPKEPFIEYARENIVIRMDYFSSSALDFWFGRVYIRNMMKFLKWVGEWLFIIFVLLPLILISLSVWRKEMEDND